MDRIIGAVLIALGVAFGSCIVMAVCLLPLIVGMLFQGEHLSGWWVWGNLFYVSFWFGLIHLLEQERR